jgi:hypothetical protein
MSYGRSAGSPSAGVPYSLNLRPSAVGTEAPDRPGFTRSTAGDLPLVIRRLVMGVAAVLCLGPFGREVHAVVLDLLRNRHNRQRRSFDLVTTPVNLAKLPRRKRKAFGGTQAT